jgi:hypothetical protein
VQVRSKEPSLLVVPLHRWNAAERATESPLITAATVAYLLEAVTVAYLVAVAAVVVGLQDLQPALGQHAE